MYQKYIPGWFLMFVLAVVSIWLSKTVELGGKHPLEPAVLAILAGILLRNVSLMPSVCEAGVGAFEKVLVLGIVLMGATLDYRTIGSQGVEILAVVSLTMATSFIVIYVLSRAFRLPSGLSILLAVGTTICGGTAIAITAPLIKAKEEDTSYAIATIALWGLAAILFYPMIAELLGASDFEFGVFAGTAIHSTPQVVGAGFIFSEDAGQTATAVKLVRNCFMLPLVLIIALWHSRKRISESDGMPFSKVFPWFLFGFFVMAGFNTAGYLTLEGVSAFKASGKFLILLGMAGIGLNTRLSAFKSTGLRPLLVGLLGSGIVAGCSALLISLIL